MADPESQLKPSGLEDLKKSFGFDSIGKALGLDWLRNLVPSFKKAVEVATKNKDAGFMEKVGIFLTSFNEEKDKLDGDKKQIATDATEKVKGIIAEAPKAKPAQAPDSVSKNAPSSSPETTSEVDPNEAFVKGEDHFGHEVILRKSAMNAFKNAMKIAEGKGMRLSVTSSYRSFKSQEKLHSHGVEKYGTSEKANKWVAKAGHSNHHTGGTMDIAAMVKNSDGKWIGGAHHPNQKYLWEILPKAGFVNYDPEPWHWEIYTARWRDKKHLANASIYKKQASLTA